MMLALSVAVGVAEAEDGTATLVFEPPPPERLQRTPPTPPGELGRPPLVPSSQYGLLGGGVDRKL